MQQPYQYDLTGNRTRVYAVRGRRLDRLTNRPYRMLVYIITDKWICLVFFEKNFGLVKLQKIWEENEAETKEKGNQA